VIAPVIDPKIKIFAICGGIGNGKSALADILAYQVHWKSQKRTVRLPLAAPLKAMCSAIGWDGNKDAKGRKLLQAVGTAGREYDPDIWIKHWMQAVSRCQEGDVVICDDLRYLNEAEAVLLLNGIIISVDRPDNPVKDDHASEREWHQIRADIKLINDGTLTDLAAKLKEALSVHGE
jgi:hypothetical protein